MAKLFGKGGNGLATVAASIAGGKVAGATTKLDLKNLGVTLSTIPVRDIETSRIVPDPGQPRKTFDPEKLQGLADSLKSFGQLQNVAVYWSEEDDRYRLIWGERRWRASGLAGLKSLSARVFTTRPSKLEIKLYQLAENGQRDDVNAIEEAEGFAETLQEMKAEDPKATAKQLAERLGVTQAALSKRLALLTLAPRVREFVKLGRIDWTAAYPLRQLKDFYDQSRLAEEAFNLGWTATRVESEVKKILEGELAPEAREELRAGEGRPVAGSGGATQNGAISGGNSWSPPPAPVGPFGDEYPTSTEFTFPLEDGRLVKVEYNGLRSFHLSGQPEIEGRLYMAYDESSRKPDDTVYSYATREGPKAFAREIEDRADRERRQAEWDANQAAREAARVWGWQPKESGDDEWSYDFKPPEGVAGFNFGLFVSLHDEAGPADVIALLERALAEAKADPKLLEPVPDEDEEGAAS